MAAFLADRAAFDPATWDADQERAARATVVETHAGKVVPVDPAARGRGERPGDVRATTRSRRWPRSRRRSSRWSAADDERPGRGRRALAAASAARAAAGPGRIRAASFRHDGHNLMRYRPEAVSAAILSVADEADALRGLRARCRSSTRRPTSGTTSRSRRSWACRSRPTRSPSAPSCIRAALEADGGFELAAPTEHGEAPITAVHDPGLVRFLEVAWSEVAAPADRPPVPVAPTPTRTGRCSRGCPTGRRRPSSASPSTPAGGPASGASTRRRRWSPGRTSRPGRPSTSR